MLGASLKPGIYDINRLKMIFQDNSKWGTGNSMLSNLHTHRAMVRTVHLIENKRAFDLR